MVADALPQRFEDFEAVTMARCVDPDTFGGAVIDRIAAKTVAGPSTIVTVAVASVPHITSGDSVMMVPS